MSWAQELLSGLRRRVDSEHVFHATGEMQNDGDDRHFFTVTDSRKRNYRVTVEYLPEPVAAAINDADGARCPYRNPECPQCYPERHDTAFFAEASEKGWP